MWTKRLVSLAYAGCCAAAFAEPRIAAMDAQLEAGLARADFLFVWDLDMATIGRGDPHRTWSTYYEGLMYAVTEARRLIEPGTPALVSLEPMAAVKDWDEAYSATLVSRETHLDGAPVVMHAEITRRDCDRKRAQLFFALSFVPRNDAHWDGLRRTRAAIACDKSKN